MADLLPYQQRVIEEKVEIDTKIEGLRAFMISDEMKSVSLYEQHLLLDQMTDMTEYSRTLERRIKMY